jgi:predicted nucleic-acid-binding protein
MKIADANYYLRYLLKDNIKQYEIAKELLECNEVYLPVEVLCEIIYVLEKVYKVGRVEICDSLGLLLQQMEIKVASDEAIENALILYKEIRLDFVDCLLAAYSKINGDDIYSFDERLAKAIARFE